MSSSRLFAGSTDWVAGIYYLGDRENLQRRYTYLDSDFSSRYDTDTYALFGQLDSQLGERFTLITGLRTRAPATRTTGTTTAWTATRTRTCGAAGWR